MMQPQTSDIRQRGAMVFPGIRQPWPDCQALKLIRPWSEPHMSEAWSGRIEIKDVVQRSGGRCNWSELGKDGLVAFAKWEIAAKGIRGRRELEDMDSGLYQALVRRKLMNAAFSDAAKREHLNCVDGVLGALDSFGDRMPPAGRMQEKNGSRETDASQSADVAIVERRRLGLLSGMRDVELAGYAEWIIASLGIKTRNGLACKDAGLYSALKTRGLLGGIGLPDSFSRWAEMADDELVSFAKRVIEEKAVGGKIELERADSKLHGALKRRGLLDRLGLEREGPDWRKMGRDEIAGFAKSFIKENSVSGRWELQVRFPHVYSALKRRRMIGELGLNEKTRNWGRINADELAEYAKKFAEERGIAGKEEFRKADRGLYGALKKRDLIGRLGFNETRRTWKGMEPGELVARAKEFIAREGIRTRKMLQKRDSGIFNALYKRGLLDAAFARIESSKHADAVDGVLDALESFGDVK